MLFSWNYDCLDPCHDPVGLWGWDECILAYLVWPGEHTYNTHTHTYACVDLEHGTLAIAQRRLVHDMPRKWKRHEETCVYLQSVCENFVDWQLLCFASRLHILLFD